jgi:hypothetical protein
MITLEVAQRKLIRYKEKHKGQIFSCVFVKRTTGEVRRMVCRFGVVRFLSGGGAKYSFEEKHLIPVFDMVKHDYRCINLDSIMKIRMKGKTYVVKTNL